MVGADGAAEEEAEEDAEEDEERETERMLLVLPSAELRTCCSAFSIVRVDREIAVRR